MRLVPIAPLVQSAMPRAGNVCVHRSVWSPTSPCVAAMALPTTASVSCTYGPAKNRWNSESSARESAVSIAYIFMSNTQLFFLNPNVQPLRNFTELEAGSSYSNKLVEMELQGTEMCNY